MLILLLSSTLSAQIKIKETIQLRQSENALEKLEKANGNADSGDPNLTLTFVSEYPFDHNSEVFRYLWGSYRFYIEGKGTVTVSGLIPGAWYTCRISTRGPDSPTQSAPFTGKAYIKDVLVKSYTHPLVCSAYCQASFTFPIVVPCADAPQCTVDLKSIVPNLNVTYLNNGSDCETDDGSTIYEYFKPKTKNNDKFFGNIEYDVCYNSSGDSWQINPSNSNLQMNAELVFCDRNNDPNYVVLTDISELKNIPESEACKVMTDLGNNAAYGAGVKYIIEEVYLTHGQIHLEQYQNLIDNTWDPSSIFDLSLSCKEATDKDSALNEAKNRFNTNLTNYRNNILKNKYKQIQGLKNSAKRAKFENKTHGDLRILEIVNKYLNEFEKLYPNLDCSWEN